MCLVIFFRASFTHYFVWKMCWKTVWCLSGTWLSFQKNKLTALHQLLLGISLYQIYPYLHFKLPKRNCYQRFKVDKARHLVLNQGIDWGGKNIHVMKERHGATTTTEICCATSHSVIPWHDFSYLPKEITGKSATET